MSGVEIDPGVEAGRVLEHRQHAVERVEIGRGLDLGQAHLGELRAEDAFEVAEREAGGERVDAHRAGLAAARQLDDAFLDQSAARHLVAIRHRVLEVEDQMVGAARDRLGDPVGLVAGDEESRAGDAHAVFILAPNPPLLSSAVDASLRSALFVRRSIALALATAAALGSIAPAGAAERPNVLIVMTDQEAPALRLPPLERPNFERLAARGVSFTRAYAAYPVCSPSRAALLTGLYPHQNGVLENVNPGVESPPLDPSIPNLGSVFAAAGWSTAWFGKWHLSANEAIPRYGFAHVYQPPRGNNGREGDPEVAAHAAAWIREREDRRALARGGVDPQPARHRRARSLRRRRDRAVSGRAAGELRRRSDRARAARPSCALTPASRRENRTPTDHAAWIHYLRLYCHLLERNDPLLGTVLDAVAARADAQRTIIVYTSDHGEMGGAHRMAQKRFLYEESVRVPLLFVYPGAEPGGEERAPGVERRSSRPRSRRWRESSGRRRCRAGTCSRRFQRVRRRARPPRKRCSPRSRSPRRASSPSGSID